MSCFRVLCSITGQCECRLTPFLGINKAVVADPAGPASAGPLFWPNMLSAISLFALSAATVVLTCDLIPSNHQKCRVLLIRLSLTHVMARAINRHSQGVKTIRPVVTSRAKQCYYYNDTCLIKVVNVKGLAFKNGRFINGMITRWPWIKNVYSNKVYSTYVASSLHINTKAVYIRTSSF